MGSKTILILCLAALPGFAQTRVPQRPNSATLHRPASLGYLGVGVVDLTDERVKALKLKDDSGVEVKRVDDNSPASKAGLKENDVVLEVNGRPIADIEQFQTAIGEIQPGTKVSLAIWRDGAKQSAAATLAARPDNAFPYLGPDSPNAPPLPPLPQAFGNAFPADAPAVGFFGAALNSQMAEFLGVKQGVLVWEVAPKTAAERAGLKAGDVVTRVNGTPVTNPKEITGLVRMSGKKTIVFTVVRNKKEMTLNVEVADNRQSPPEREVL
jgi:S1-C subfamily serine protease